MASITFVMADTDLTPFDQGTFGSRTTPTMAPELARAAATAREMLIDLAAAKWSGRSRHARGAEPARSLEVGARTIGDVRQISRTGRISRGACPRAPPNCRATNGSSVVRRSTKSTPATSSPAGTSSRRMSCGPGCSLAASSIRPALGATPKSVDDSKARAMPGVTVVRDGDFIGVVAPNERIARRAAAAIAVDWNLPAGLPTSETIFEHLKKTAVPDGGRGGDSTGNVAAARTSAARTFDATFDIPYIAHVPLEPRAAVAEWTGGKVTVWTGTQRPFGIRGDLAQAFRLAEDRVRVIAPDSGSGYGGKHTNAAAIEAARLAKAVAHPVKLVYTRAEEFMWGYFRPAGVIAISAGVDANGTARVLGVRQLQLRQFGPLDAVRGAQQARVVSQRGLAVEARVVSRAGRHRQSLRARDAHGRDRARSRRGSGRVQAQTHHRAAAARRAADRRGEDPAGRIRRRPAARSASPAARKRAATSQQPPKSRAPPDGFKVERIVAAFECGAIVNPDGLNNQVEGAIVQGLGGALFEAIRVRERRDPERHDGPISRAALPGRAADRGSPDRSPGSASAGAGETPIVCVAPAIGSAARAFGTVATELPVRLV